MQETRAEKNQKIKVIEFKDLVKLGQKIHKKGQKIVFTIGSFELITPGHCRFLAETKALGDILVVGAVNRQLSCRLAPSKNST